MKQSATSTFKEVQYFRSPWLWLVVGGVAVLQWWRFLQQIVFGRQWGNQPAPNWMMVLLWFLFGIGLPGLFFFGRLSVTVSDNAIQIRLLPFADRTILLSDITDVEARTYSPLREFGGWGVRFGAHGKRAYNVSGNQGVELTLTNGHKVLIGSQHPQELASAIEAAR